MDVGHFDGEVYAARRSKVAARLGGVRALIASGRPVARNYAANTYPFRAASHFLYLIGLPLRSSFALLEGERCFLYVPRPGEDDALWHGPNLSFDALAELSGCVVRPLDELSRGVRGNVATLAAPDAPTRVQQRALLGREVGAAAMTDMDMTLADAIIAARLVHDAAAIESLERAADATVFAHRAGMTTTRPLVREHVIRAAMEAELMARGMTTAYPSIVTVHGEVLHHDSYGNELRAGDLLLADVGAESEDGWAADVTRTWPVSGSFSPSQRDIYEAVLGAQIAAIDAVRPGVRYRDIHLAAARQLTTSLVALGLLRGDVEELVADAVYAVFFPHGIGHLLGLDVHDMEDLGDRAGYAPGRARSSQPGLRYLRLDRELEEGMAVTIEPGFYMVPAILEDPARVAYAGDRLQRHRIDAFRDVRGIRIEDDVLVTRTGCRILSERVPKRAEEVEAHVGVGASLP